MNKQDIQERINKLNDDKQFASVGSPSRRKLNKELRELNKKLLVVPLGNKDRLIEEIYRLDPIKKELTDLDLYKFNEEELKKHINHLKTRRR